VTATKAPIKEGIFLEGIILSSANHTSGQGRGTARRQLRGSSQATARQITAAKAGHRYTRLLQQW
jgi:hypothetical protein